MRDSASPKIMNAIQRLLRTDAEITPAILRLLLGVVFFPHGAQKALGWFGGYGFNATMEFFTQTMHIPSAFAVLEIAAEFLGALGLIVGLFTRVAAFGIASIMVVAVATVHGANGFFMNWSGKQSGEGYEYHLLVLGIAIAVMIKGGGAGSIDRVLTAKGEEVTPA